ncbi:uncharacterized protein [Asterias amurensis]|uniref:uncharacterized protein n=1 Tax=Asterias amurensis TaxID=7602 RepID=UPI003AB789E5
MGSSSGMMGLRPKPRASGVKAVFFLVSFSVWMCKLTGASSDFDDEEIYTTMGRFCNNRCETDSKGRNQCCVNVNHHCQKICVYNDCLQCLRNPGMRNECLQPRDVTCRNSTCGYNREHVNCICLQDLNRCVDEDYWMIYYTDMTDTKAPETSGNEVNVTAIILGWILSLVLLLVIIGAVVCYFQRKCNSSGQPSMVSSDVELTANGSSRAQLAVPPPPPPLGGSVGYSYAYDHVTTNRSTEVHTYDYVDDGEGSSHYFKNGQRKSSSEEKGGVTEDANETQVQEVPVRDEGDEVTGVDVRITDDVVEVTDSPSGVRATAAEVIDPTYFTLIPTEEQKAQSEASGNEVAAVPNEGNVASSSTEVLTQKAQIEASGYEVAAVHHDGNVASSATEALTQNIQNEASGYEVAAVPNEGDTASSSSEVHTQKAQHEASGYEVAAVPHEGNVASSSTEVLTQKAQHEASGYEVAAVPNEGDTASSSSEVLTQKAQHEASGYEVAAVPHEGNVASSSTEVFTQKGDHNTYFPLLLNNTDQKSTKEGSDRNQDAGVMQPATNTQSWSETSCPSLKTTGAEETTSYDHLVRDPDRLSHDGALSGQNNNDNYQHLKV